MRRSRIFIAIGVIALISLVWWRWSQTHQQEAKPQVTPTVVVAPVAVGTLDDATEALGTARAKQAADLTAKVTDIVEKIEFADGQMVKKGDVIIRLNTSEAAAQLDKSQADVKEQRQEYDRVKTLVDKKVLAISRLQQQEAALNKARAQYEADKAQVDNRIITAPFDGVLGLRQVSAGSLVSPGTVITSLQDIGTIQVDFTLSERDLAIAKPGLEVEARTDAYPDRVFKGQVIAVDNRVDPNSRAITLRAEITNSDLMLKPGMLLKMHVMQPDRQALLIPEEALLSEKDKQYVLTVDASGKVARQEVTLGRRLQHQVEVTGGLKEGELIVIEGVQKAKPGSQVNATRRGEAKAGAPE